MGNLVIKQNSNRNILNRKHTSNNDTFFLLRRSWGIRRRRNSVDSICFHDLLLPRRLWTFILVMSCLAAIKALPFPRLFSTISGIVALLATTKALATFLILLFLTILSLVLFPLIL